MNKNEKEQKEKQYRGLKFTLIVVRLIRIVCFGNWMRVHQEQNNKNIFSNENHSPN